MKSKRERKDEGDERRGGGRLWLEQDPLVSKEIRKKMRTMKPRIEGMREASSSLLKPKKMTMGRARSTRPRHGWCSVLGSTMEEDEAFVCDEHGGEGGGYRGKAEGANERGEV